VALVCRSLVRRAVRDLPPGEFRPMGRIDRLNPHIARDFVARAVEVRKVRARRAKWILEVWGRIVLKYLRVRTSRIDPKISCLRRSQQKDSCKLRATLQLAPLAEEGAGLPVQRFGIRTRKALS